MDVKVLGTGCAKCKKLYEAAEKAIAEAGLPVSLTKVEKLEDILTYSVMMTPALVVSGEVKSAGRIPKTEEIVSWLRAASGR